jgi:hypothetical protein
LRGDEARGMEEVVESTVSNEVVRVAKVKSTRASQ